MGGEQRQWIGDFRAAVWRPVEDTQINNQLSKDISGIISYRFFILAVTQGCWVWHGAIHNPSLGFILCPNKVLDFAAGAMHQSCTKSCTIN